jgi:hypothetical protein
MPTQTTLKWIKWPSPTSPQTWDILVTESEGAPDGSETRILNNQDLLYDIHTTSQSHLLSLRSMSPDPQWNTRRGDRNCLCHLHKHHRIPR